MPGLEPEVRAGQERARLSGWIPASVTGVWLETWSLVRRICSSRKQERPGSATRARACRSAPRSDLPPPPVTLPLSPCLAARPGHCGGYLFIQTSRWNHSARLLFCRQHRLAALFQAKSPSAAHPQAIDAPAVAATPRTHHTSLTSRRQQRQSRSPRPLRALRGGAVGIRGPWPLPWMVVRTGEDPTLFGPCRPSFAADLSGAHLQHSLASHPSTGSTLASERESPCKRLPVFRSACHRSAELVVGRLPTVMTVPSLATPAV